MNTKTPAPNALRVTEDRLLRGLIAALAIEQVSWLSTVADEHHHRLIAALHELESQRRDHHAGAVSMPRTVAPSPFTERVATWDAALLAACSNGWADASRTGVRLRMSATRAGAVLDRFEPAQREVLATMARAYLGFVDGSQSR